MNSKPEPTNGELRELIEHQQRHLEEQRVQLLRIQSELQMLHPEATDARAATRNEPVQLSRRGLLGAAVLGAAGVAGVDAILRPETAAAANPPVLLDQSNVGTSTTSIDTTATSGTVSFEGDSTGTGIGIQGTNVDSGIFRGSGMYGQAQSGTGVYGSSTGGNGVYGSSGSGNGVYATSDTYIGVNGQGTYGGAFAGTTAPLFLAPSASPGAPTVGFHGAGEVYVDVNGTFYVCTTSGSPGTWMQLGGIGLQSFPNPRRVFHQVMIPGEVLTAIDATVKQAGGPSGVPAGARAMYAAVQSDQPGRLTLYPNGTTDPGIASWTNNGTSGILYLSYMLAPLDATGKFSIHSYIGGNIYVDAWGYLP